MSEDEWLADFGDDAEMDHDWNEWGDDRDAFYSEKEFGAGMFSRFDFEESGYLDEDEAAAFGEAGEEAGRFE